MSPHARDRERAVAFEVRNLVICLINTVMPMKFRSEIEKDLASEALPYSNARRFRFAIDGNRHPRAAVE